MKALKFVFLLSIVFAGCNKPQVKTLSMEQAKIPFVIDYPAGVVVRTDASKSQSAARLLKVEAILAAHRIPVIDTNSQQLVFVKHNGDRVVVNMNELKGKYDIILFNAVNDPVPLRFSDLKRAAGQIFTEDSVPIWRAKQADDIKESSVVADSLPSQPQRSGIVNWLRSRDKRLVFARADTAAQALHPRNIAGIEWVEHRIDTRSLLTLTFENDLITYANTDRYFTNGITIDYQSARLSKAALNRLMVPYGHKAFVSYQMSLVQDMFTPTDTKVAPSLHEDRPYSSYLYLSYSKKTADPLRQIILTSRIDFGYLGPYSPGSYMQTLVHKTFPTNDLPLGWETQINTDVILNYSVKVQTALVSNPKFLVLAGANVKAGTLFNSAGANLQLQTGKFAPVFGITEGEKWPKAECYFFAKTDVNLVAYNALLQGGMLNRNNIFTLKADEIHRLVAGAEAGFRVQYKKVGFEMAQHYISPEYKKGLWHKWGRMSLLFRL